MGETEDKRDGGEGSGPERARGNEFAAQLHGGDQQAGQDGERAEKLNENGKGGAEGGRERAAALFENPCEEHEAATMPLL